MPSKKYKYKHGMLPKALSAMQARTHMDRLTAAVHALWNAGQHDRAAAVLANALRRDAKCCATKEYIVLAMGPVGAHIRNTDNWPRLTKRGTL